MRDIKGTSLGWCVIKNSGWAGNWGNCSLTPFVWE